MKKAISTKPKTKVKKKRNKKRSKEISKEKRERKNKRKMRDSNEKNQKRRCSVVAEAIITKGGGYSLKYIEMCCEFACVVYKLKAVIEKSCLIILR